VVERLRAEYPQATCALVHETPLELLVATILSAQCTDERVNMVTPVVFERYPTVQALADAEQGELEAVIHSTGFFRMKGLAIRGMARDIVDRYGGEVPRRMDQLTTLRGVGRKTANVVLGVAFGVPGLPVDTHVTRLAARLRLTSARDPVEIETDICSMVPATDWTDLSLRLILHGRRVCVARSPRCPECVLNDICPSARLGPLRPHPAGRGGKRTAGRSAQATARKRPARSPSGS
jgi:endonuclease III